MPLKVSVRGDAKVNIRLKKEGVAPAPSKNMYLPDIASLPQNGIAISTSLIEAMEMRTESVFRPNQEDIEVVYALTGSSKNIPDAIHKFSSNEVVPHASPDKISYYTEKMVEHILEERRSIPELIAIVHTHPLGTAELSDVDKVTDFHVAKRMKELVPNANVVFGVHAVSSESRRPRTDPVKNANNSIKWSSITRLHEVAFFDKNSKPFEVTVWTKV